MAKTDSWVVGGADTEMDTPYPRKLVVMELSFAFSCQIIVTGAFIYLKRRQNLVGPKNSNIITYF